MKLDFFWVFYWLRDFIFSVLVFGFMNGDEVDNRDNGINGVYVFGVIKLYV